MTATVTIDGTAYTVGELDASWTDATSEGVCTLTPAKRAGTVTMVFRDRIAHGAFVAHGSAKLSRVPSHVLRAALEPVLGPFADVTPLPAGNVCAVVALAALPHESDPERNIALQQVGVGVDTWTPTNRATVRSTAVALGYLDTDGALTDSGRALADRLATD